MEIYEAVVGGLNLPARTGLSRLLPIAVTGFWGNLPLQTLMLLHPEYDYCTAGRSYGLEPQLKTHATCQVLRCRQDTDRGLC